MKREALSVKLKFTFLAVIFVAVILWAILSGSSGFYPTRVIKALIPGQETPDAELIRRIVFFTRLPRISVALLAGASLGMAGLASQTLFRNSLASPYVTGISGGAALGAVSGFLLCGSGSFWLLPVLGTAGGVSVALLNLMMSETNSSLKYYLLLNGIALNAFCSGLISLALFLAGERLQSLIFWLMGGMWKVSWLDTALMAPVCGFSFCALMLFSSDMDLLLLGGRNASDSGVGVKKLRIILLTVIAVSVSVTVSLTGIIGFAGLIIPHIMRLLFGARHKTLIVFSAVGGGVFLLLSDTLARTMAAPAEIPVGILTSLAGAPVLMHMLNRKKRIGE